jgi:phage terminase large subunit
MERVGPYWHMLPMANQARKAIWDAVNPKTGRRRIDDAFPPEIRESTRENDMFIRFKNGSTWQVVGSDNYNSLVGSPPVGIVFSEYALADPSAWALLAADPVGKRWMGAVHQHDARTEPLPQAGGVRQEGGRLVRRDADGGGHQGDPDEAIETERRELIAERGEQEATAIIAQEYYCDADASIPGAYYGALMSKALKEERIGLFPWIPNEPCGTAWDLGHGDSTVVWVYQQPPSGRVRIIDVISSNGVGIDWYVRKLKDRPYDYADHIWPHDGGHGNIRDVGGDTLKITAGKLGLKPLRVLANDMSVEHGIGAVRNMLPLCEFNTEPIPFDNETVEEARQRAGKGA